jgi:hypothetical protein
MRQSENNRNTGKDPQVHLFHKFKRGRPDRDNHVRCATLIFAKVEIAKLLLVGQIGTQCGIHILRVELKVIG